LTSKPFQLNPDPTFYYGSKQHKRASAYLEYGMHQNEGFIVITGDVGAGKTTIVRGLLDSLDPSKVVAAHLVSTQLDADDTLRLVASAFGVRTKDVAKSDVLLSLEAFLVNATRQNKRCLLIVDEAQNLTPRAVEELRMLSNFQFGSYALLQTFLIGQPEFRDILQSPEMLQLRQRVIATCHINPMDRQETQGYIEHRLKCAGAQDKPSFDAAAFDGIFLGSGGVPRRINTLCDRVLLFGFLAGKSDFSGEDVKEILREIEEEAQTTSSVRPQAMPRTGDVRAGEFPLDLAGSALDIAPQVVNEASALIAAMGQDQLGERLLRLERGMLRLERINSAMLTIMQQLLEAARGARSE
jgi:putative secretion ATPase (PEP-CTERM system associated)